MKIWCASKKKKIKKKLGKVWCLKNMRIKYLFAHLSVYLIKSHKIPQKKSTERQRMINKSESFIFR